MEKSSPLPFRRGGEAGRRDPQHPRWQRSRPVRTGSRPKAASPTRSAPSPRRRAQPRTPISRSCASSRTGCLATRGVAAPVPDRRDRRLADGRGAAGGRDRRASSGFRAAPGDCRPRRARPRSSSCPCATTAASPGRSSCTARARASTRASAQAARLTAAQAALALRVFAGRARAQRSSGGDRPGGGGARRRRRRGAHGRADRTPGRRCDRCAADASSGVPATKSSSSLCATGAVDARSLARGGHARALRGARPDRGGGSASSSRSRCRSASRLRCAPAPVPRAPGGADLAAAGASPAARRRRCAPASGRGRCAASSSARATSSRSSARRPRSSRSRTRSRPRSPACRSCSRSSASACTCATAGGWRPPPRGTSPGRTRSSPRGCSTLRSARSGRVGSSPRTTPRTTAASRRVRAAATEAGIEAAHAVPLVAHGDVIGLLAVYPPRGRALTSDQSALLGGARRPDRGRGPERAAARGDEAARHASASRRSTPSAVAARRLSALYEISRSFAQSLSLDSTLDAVARTLVELLDVDAAVIRLPDERGESLVAAGRPRREPAAAAGDPGDLRAPEPSCRRGRRRLAEGRPVRLDAASAAELGRSHGLLVPFLETRLDRGRDPDRDALRAARDADARLARSGAARSPTRRSTPH